jgi:cytochrome c oxidase cbb3-type subunit 3
MSDQPQGTELPEGAPDDPLTGHAYDGIQEYDNPLPGWWKWLFVASVVVSPVYFMFYHGGAEGRGVVDYYDRALAKNLELQFAEFGDLTLDRDSLVRFLYKPSGLKIGKVVFKSNCVTCHGAEGGGQIGPNLCDEQFKNIKDIEDILTVLQKGAGGGAMPAWNTRLSANQILMVSAYVASLRGSKPAKPKDPEGRVIPPWPDEPAAEPEAAETDEGEAAPGPTESE